MFKLLTQILILAVFFIFSSQEILAQSNSYELLKQEYYKQFDEYKVALDKYNHDRAEYLKFETLVSQSVALETTKTFLIERNDVLVAYLRLIKERLEQTPLLTEEELGKKIIYINEEIEFINEQTPTILAAASLKDIESVSKKIQTRYGRFLRETFFMKSLIVISKVRSLRQTTRELETLTNEQVARIEKEGAINTLEINRWLLEVPAKINLSEETETNAISSYKPSNSANYNQQSSAY